MKKQIFLLILMFMPMMLSASTEINGIYYNLDNSVAEVTTLFEDEPWWWDGPPHAIPSYTGEIVIPKTVIYGGVTYSVTSIGYHAFYHCSGLTSVTIPNSVTSISVEAFENCTGLTSVTIGNSVTSIEEWAFSGCSNLTSVTIPNSVTSIGVEAFGGCTGLTSVTIGNSVTSIGDGAFGGCTGLTSITIPNSVTSIGDYAFSDCSNLTSINIGNNVTNVGEDAFGYCSNLEKVTFHCKEIGAWFSGITSIKDIVIGDEVTNIGGGAFSGCSGLTSVNISDLAAWCNISFSSNSNPLNEAHHLFLNGEEVKNLVIPNSVTSIGDYAFSGCFGLTSITIPNSVMSIGDYAFNNCTGLTSITIPNSVTSIGGYALRNCTGLISITIGNNVTNVGEDAFGYCSNLEKVTFLCKEIGAWFSGITSIKDIVIGDEVTNIGGGAFSGCSGLTSVNISDLAAWCNISFSSNSNPLNEAHHLFLNGEEVKNLVIPTSVTSIGDYAFSGCLGLTSITIPNSVTSIGNDAFSGCSSLISVKIDDLASWCKIVFSNSYSNPLYFAKHLCLNGEEIKDLVLPNDVTSIGNYTFYGCTELKSATIPNSVTSIGNSAFYSCSNISSVSIGSGINTIGANAFAQCPEIHEVYCYAEKDPTINGDTFQDSYYIKYATLYVPESSVEQYKMSAWSQFGNIVGIAGGNEGEKCEKPTITLLANGKIKVESATEGATCFTNITVSNAEPLTDSEINLNTPLTVYTVTAYATADGYADSDVATATFRWEKKEGDMNGDGQVNIADVIQLVNIILQQ